MTNNITITRNMYLVKFNPISFTIGQNIANFYLYPDFQNKFILTYVNECNIIKNANNTILKNIFNKEYIDWSRFNEKLQIPKFH